MSELGDGELMERFEAQAIPLDDWNHRAHLRICYQYLTSRRFEAALAAMRDGVKAFNAANDISYSETSGYHETLTQAWLQLVHSAITEFGVMATADAFFDAQTQLGEKRILLLFYTRDLIMSWDAKRSFVEPDLTLLPPVKNPERACGGADR